MRIVVCTKETPDTAAKVEVSAGEVTWGDAPLVINPWDEYTVEAGLTLVEEHGAEGCTVLAVGGEDTPEALKHAIAMGCDEAALVKDEVMDASDPSTVSKALAEAVKKMDNIGLVMLGKLTTDGNGGATPSMVGRHLGWPTLTFVSAIRDVDFEAGTITVERLVEEGKQICESPLPAVVSVVKEINEPRYPSFMGIRKAAKAQYPEWGADDLGLEGTLTAKTVMTHITEPPKREAEVTIIEGSPEEAAAELADKLINEEKVI